MVKINFTKDALYEGIVKHSRFKPFNHNFKYKLTYFWFDICNFGNFLTFRRNKISCFTFCDNDHGSVNEKKVSLYEYLQKKLKKNSIYNIKSIKAFCLPRILGYVFNPISIFVCYDKKKNAKVIIFEVSNTFNERHAYICKVRNEKFFNIKKKFYVSPFFKVKGSYKIKFSIDNNLLNFFIFYEVNNQKVFEASFSGRSRQMSEINLLKVLFGRIFQNLQVTFGIYIQALKLFFKGAIYVKKPKKPDDFFSSVK